MKAASIILFILSSILPAVSYCFAETAAAKPSPGLNVNDAPLASDPSNAKVGKKEAKTSSVRWHNRKSHIKLNGVALVIHGLNCRPDKMTAIIAKLNARGIDCLNLSLRGHGENYTPITNTTSADARMQAFKSVTYPLWKNEAYQAYRLVERKSHLHGAPLFFVGFSMGGLLGVDLFASNPNVKFDSMVLLAPALKMRARNSLLKILSPFPGIVVPSIAIRSYLANDGTPVAAYNALFEMNAHFENNPDPKINIPTIVFIDKQDELISFSGLQEMVRNQNLDQWKIHAVKKDKTATEVKMYHLIIDEASAGSKMWQEIVDATITHFLSGQSADAIDG